MLLIDTYLAESSVHGIGVFAAEDIAEGTLIWKFHPAFDSVIRKEEISDLPTHMLNWLFVHAWQNEEGHFCIGIDNDKYINHSENPNSIYQKESNTWIAARDIKKGEELTDDYREFSESDYANSLRGDDEYDPAMIDGLVDLVKNSGE